MLEEEIARSGALTKGDFTLASGQKSNYYIDLRIALTKPHFLESVAVAMSKRIGNCKRIAGVELGAIPIAAAVSLETGLPFIMVRKYRKSHGAGKLIEGELEEGDQVLLVEDTVTSGGTLITAIEAIREKGGIVKTALVVVDRKEGGKENLAKVNVNMITLADIEVLKELAGV